MHHKPKLKPEEKMKIVRQCLSGELGANEASRNWGVARISVQRWIAKKHKISNPSQLEEWIRVYNAHDNPLVYKTFDKAVQANPDAPPLFHSDRGFQYTSRAFHHKLQQAGMIQSMSRVAHCIDNGPMEDFWGILKRERYYGRRFTSKQELIQHYIRYYNTRRVQRNLGVLTPIGKYERYLAA